MPFDKFPPGTLAGFGAQKEERRCKGDGKMENGRERGE